MSDECISCRFFNNSPALIERVFPGLNSLSSAYASVRADSGICSRHELFLSSWKSCEDFENRLADFSSPADKEDSQSSLIP